MIATRSAHTLPILGAGIGMALLLGYVSALGNPLLLAPFVALGGLLLLAIVPIRLAFWAFFVISFLLVGPVMYFGKIESARWIPPLMALALWLPLLVHAFKPRKPAPSPGWPSWALVLVLFLASAVVGTLATSPNLGEVVVALRAYGAFWTVTLLLAIGLIPARDMVWVWKAMFACAVLQVPVALYQYMVVAKTSTRLSPWDAVVGTFPGNMEGGGASQGMGIFLLIALAGAMCLWRVKAMRSRTMALVLVAAVAAMGLAEVKAAVLLVPVVFVLVFYRELAKRPLLTVGAVVVSVALMGGLLLVYESTFYAHRGMTLSGKMPTSPLESVQNQFNPDREFNRSDGTGIMISRAASMADWWDHNVRHGDPFHTLLGYGIGATQISKIGMGELAPKFPYLLDMIGTTLLLWETGVIGHVLLVAALLMAAYNTARSARAPMVPVEHRALLEAASIGLVLLTITLPYSNFSLRTPPSQFLLFFLLGYSTYWWRAIRQDRTRKIDGTTTRAWGVRRAGGVRAG